MAKTGPQNAGFTEEAGYNLEMMDMSHDDSRIPIDDEDRSPLETAILTRSDLVFVKLHASWSTMIRVAEVLQFRKPLKQVRVFISDSRTGLFRLL